MRIGIPKEIKILEGRVALIPAAAAQLVAHGHMVFIETGAGDASGYSDDDYRSAGLVVVENAAALYTEAELIVKVKEPIEPEYALLRPDHLLFCFLHLAAAPELAKTLCDKGLTAVAFETIEQNHSLPLLAPMSDIAGRLSVQIGANLLHHYNGGRGILLGGMPAAERGNVVVLGAGSAGGNAVQVAAKLGANVTVFARSRNSLSRMQSVGDNVTPLPSYAKLIEEHTRVADLLIGAALIPGARAPRLVSEELVMGMKSGSVIVDIAVDQGGCIATTRPTDYESPTFIKHGVVHFGVTNMPGAVPRTSSQALSASLASYVLLLAEDDGLKNPIIQTGINIQNGEIIHPTVKASFSSE